MKKRDVEVFRPAVRFGLVGMLIGSLAVIVTGDLLAHCIDTAMWLNGPIKTVSAMTETFIKERKHADTGKVEKVDVGFDLVQALIGKQVDAVIGGYWVHESILAELKEYIRIPNKSVAFGDFSAYVIKQLPLPMRKLVGDLSNEEHVLLGLNLTRR